MDKVLQALLDAIKTAAASEQGFGAVLLVAMVTLAYVFFRKNTSETTRIFAFIVVLLAGGTLYYLIWRNAPPLAPNSINDVIRSKYLIDFQYAGDRTKAQDVAEKLKDRGWRNEGVERQAFTQTLVKYGADSNRIPANLLVQDLKAITGISSITTSQDLRIKSNHLEAWAVTR